MSVEDDHSPEGMTRRQLMRHTAWFGAAVVLTVTGGEVISQIARPGEQPVALAKDPNALRFVQISDSHLGFKGTANAAVEQSFADAIQQINALPYRSDFVVHTGDLTHLSTPAQFDQVKQMMGGLNTGHVFTVPGEHDSIDDHGQKYRKAFGKGTVGDGWYSFDLGGVHFISLVNTLSLESLGHLGKDQVEFVRQDTAKLSADTPIVVFSHIPLFALYPKWGWGTDDATQALSYLKRFSSVTCLNGHIHQLFTKTEGNITFHSATTTAYPLPRPGERPAPTPVTLPAGKLKDALGIREVQYVEGNDRLAIKDVKLA
ncbi:metallophosphoesterase [Kribbella sp. NBC_00662]|uniref:metallophosphoesterase family protein n=1 Tax=Kribbella sp. NBC_00662 TaxID=2975969 RepID=UPI0032522E78